MTRISVMKLIMTAVIILVFMLAANRAKLVPSRFQSLVELGVTFVNKTIAEDTLGPRLGKKYAPILSVIFFSLLFFNVTSLIPGMNIAVTSVVALPVIFAFAAYFTFISAGIKEQGLGHFFKTQLFPPGAPWPVYFILTPIEFFSTFVVRPATLVIRLVVNMIAGHILLALCFFGTYHLFFFTQNMALKSVGVLTFAAAIIMTIFELLVIVLQAYVFTILSCVYIKLSVEEH